MNNHPQPVDETPSLERNINAFNADTAAHGGYVYTSNGRWSSQYATGRQTEELLRMLAGNFPKSVRVVDIGCGDGAYTMEIAERFGPASLRGVDPASNAIEAASGRIASEQIRTHLSGSVSFEVGDIYTVQSRGETLAVARGVLHHLDRPQAAIAQLARQFKFVLALEPNGYNPAMKLIEKTSAYHREHDEKSYWPPTLNEWFRSEGFSVICQRYFCLVPYFCPTPVAKLLRTAESTVESLPGMRQFCCGTNLVLYGRADG